ncbi:hypothetical protein [Borrelia hispanica]|uniref:hypothetical protein n=1 Tax=Borrelia hispanica TaxID=40835 RepID=UPI0004BCA23D|nr:hypothetical protein [Borrelia hispanica]
MGVLQPAAPAAVDSVIEPEVPAAEEVVQPKETGVKKRVKKYYEQDGKYKNKFNFYMDDPLACAYEESKTRNEAWEQFKSLRSLFFAYYGKDDFDSKPYNDFGDSKYFPNLVFSEIFPYHSNPFNLSYPIRYVYLAFSYNSIWIYWLAFATHQIYYVYKGLRYTESYDYNEHHKYKEAYKRFVDRLSDMTAAVVIII